ncbi:MAG: UDP-3-O-(3-hydroxymyristoyl)glucosamine N-acyltransferase [Bacteroidales bacterium]|nr:UDP-3-O-(3-hydroxymyristoyl)glucosamine N-acyltransferase [Bacteroidales bacterium]
MRLENPTTLAEVAALLHVKFDGDPGFIISGLNEIHMVEQGDLTFVDHPKYYKKALESKATTIIINKTVERPEGKALIFSDDPFTDYVRLVKKYRPFEPANQMISLSASIGEGTIIQPGAFIGNHVKIGSNCLIHANVSIYDHSILGNNVIIHSGTVIGADAFYFQRKPHGYSKFESCGRVIIEDNVEIGACCTIDKGVSGDTRIGKGTKFDNHIQIGHDTVIGKNCLFASAVVVAGVTVVEDDVILWGQVAIQKDIVIGKGAVVLATSAVDKSIEGNKVYFGVPAIEARKKWRELVALKQLPEIIARLEKERE